MHKSLLLLNVFTQRTRRDNAQTPRELLSLQRVFSLAAASESKPPVCTVILGKGSRLRNGTDQRVANECQCVPRPARPLPTGTASSKKRWTAARVESGLSKVAKSNKKHKELRLSAWSSPCARQRCFAAGAASPGQQGYWLAAQRGKQSMSWTYPLYKYVGKLLSHYRFAFRTP